MVCAKESIRGRKIRCSLMETTYESPLLLEISCCAVYYHSAAMLSVRKSPLSRTRKEMMQP